MGAMGISAGATQGDTAGSQEQMSYARGSIDTMGGAVRIPHSALTG